MQGRVGRALAGASSSSRPSRTVRQRLHSALARAGWATSKPFSKNAAILVAEIVIGDDLLMPPLRLHLLK